MGFDSRTSTLFCYGPSLVFLWSLPCCELNGITKGVTFEYVGYHPPDIHRL